MRALRLLQLLVCVLTLSATSAQAATSLEVASAGPSGEIATLAEANEIRAVFSEPMVTLGRIPSPVRAPFFRIEPQVAGTFRWSGTRTLIFTPDPKKPLPYSTRFQVTIDQGATSVEGLKLAQPYVFSFTTPTVKLLSTRWYRKNGKFSDPLVLALRFNQPVNRKSVSAHLTLNYQKHDWEAPVLPDATRERLGPEAAADFEAKVAKARAATQARSPVFYFVATDWDKKKFKDEKSLLVIETRPGVPPDSWIRVQIDDSVPSSAGAQTPSAPQEFTVQTEPTFFVRNFECVSACDPDSYNPLSFRSTVDLKNLQKRVSVSDVTVKGKQTKLKPSELKREDQDVEYESEYDEEYGHPYDRITSVTLEDLGFTQDPARSYVVSVSKELQASDGQTLGYTWLDVVENWHRSAFSSFGEGHGVWESGSGAKLPFAARNFRNVTEWAVPVERADLMPTILKLQEQYFRLLPSRDGQPRKLAPVPGTIQHYGLDLARTLGGRQSGLVWAGLKDGDPIPRAHKYPGNDVKATLVQVTNLGINVKDSPQNTLIFVTRLDSGEPVAGAKVSIVTTDNKTFWSGVTDARGLALAPNTRLRNPEDHWKFSFIVTAEKDGDIAYVGSDWNEGIEPWSFTWSFNLHEADPLLRGTVFTDRGVYKLGEEVHFKTVLRSDTPTGIQLLPKGTSVEIVLKDSQDAEVDKRNVTLNEWSSAEWTFTLPSDGSLGNYQVSAKVGSQQNQVGGTFLVAAYRRPDFRVDVNLAGDPPVAGTKLAGVVTASYLFGAPMAKRPVSWTYRKDRTYGVPRAILDNFPEDQFFFVGYDFEETPRESGTISAKEAVLDAKGMLTLSLDTKLDAGVPYQYSLEADVEDVSRQHIANRSSFLVHPAPWYVGLKPLPYFADVAKGVDTEVIAASLDGRRASGVPIRVTLSQVQWHSVRRAEGRGMYTWETERKETPAGEWQITTAQDAQTLHMPLEKGGYYMLRARAQDSAGRFTETVTSFYALGEGYTAWQRYDHNRIDLVPEKSSYKPGDRARIMIKSPWESATALITTEREGIRTYETFKLTSTQQTMVVPLTDKEIPNVFVSVLLIKGRTKATTEDDGSDPGKPAFRLGYVELKVEDSSKRLSVEVKANREEFRPASKANVTISVKDAQGKPVQAEVTLWAADYGVLSLTAFQTPDLLRSIYLHKALQVMNEDSRQRLISRRVLTPKGASEGGGGGDDSGPGTVRKDFRVLAFWLGSVVTNSKGKASVDIKLPESLTTYRIMAVAGDKVSRFGSDDSEIRINKPVLLKPAFPRFLTLGDQALFGSVVHSQLKEKGTAIVTIRSLDPSILDFTGETRRTVQIGAGGSEEVRFKAIPKAVGSARVQMTVKLRGETDAFEEVIPVRVLASPEVVAAYGESKTETARETIELPSGVVPTYGGLHLELSSTAMVGLSEGARYLVEYPYGCAEQRASTGLALILATELGDAFKLPGIDAKNLRSVAAANLKELERFQCPNGGFSFWPGECWSTSPYLTSYILHVFQRGQKLQYEVASDVMDAGYSYLDKQLAEPPPVNEGWWPAYTSWQAFAVKVLTEGGRNQDSNINRLYGYVDRMPIFGITYLFDAMTAKGEKGARPKELLRRISNSILAEGGSAHIEELSDPYLLYFWNSNVRSTALALGSIVRNTKDETFVRGLVRWLMAVRKNGRWGNTQENAIAMEALVDYYRTYEKEVPDFRAVVTFGTEAIAKEDFRGRSTVSKSEDVPMTTLLTKGKTGEKIPLTFSKEGTGTLFYVTRLRYASNDLMLEGMDNGFRVERRYAPNKSNGGDASIRNYAAGDLVKVTLTFRLTKERRFVAVTDPIPAGFEPVESWFATTASELSGFAGREDGGFADWRSWWERGGFDHVERHDDRVLLFATRLSEGEHQFSYLARATTSGTFRTAPTHVEEMYEPEVFGRTATDVVEVKP